MSSPLLNSGEDAAETETEEDAVAAAAAVGEAANDDDGASLFSNPMEVEFTAEVVKKLEEEVALFTNPVSFWC